MAKKSKGGVELVALVCSETGLRNYTTKKNRRNNPEKLELMKYCPKLRKHTLHREGKIK
ncbi:MAG: 50S ribosomal protein L33 [Spirochaetales bacterium]|nr:50S ribosomal protein L33 [Spirochaetales bacterium]